MIWRLALAAFLALCLCAVGQAPHAQFNGCSAGFCSRVTVSGATYSGPCDAIAGATAFIGFLSCSASFASAHNPAVDIADQSTHLVTATINFLSSGYWDAATAAASSPCSVACVATKFYDSSGNSNDFPVDAGKYGLITFNALNTCSAVGLSGTYAGSPTYRSSLFTSVNQPLSMVAIANRTGNVTTKQYVLGGEDGGGSAIGFSNSANTADFYDSSEITLGSVADNSWHALVGIGNGASGSISADGSTNAANAGTQAVSRLKFGADNFGSNLSAGLLIAGGMWPSSVNISTMNTNLHSLCGGF